MFSYHIILKPSKAPPGWDTLQGDPFLSAACFYKASYLSRNVHPISQCRPFVTSLLNHFFHALV